MVRYKKQSPKTMLYGFLIFIGIILIVAVPYLLIALAVSVGIYFYYNHKSENKKKQALLWSGDMDSMSGTEFEELLGVIFSNLGYKVKHVGFGGGDFGCDLIIQKDRHNIGVQAKRYSGNVGNKAVQEIYSSLPHYDADEGWVVTNSYFTIPAQKQAKSCNVTLIDRNKLLDLIVKAKDKNKTRE